MGVRPSISRAWVRGFLAGLCGILLVEGVVLYFFPPRILFRQVSTGKPGASEIKPHSLDEVRKGPWGILEACKIPIMAPGHLLPDGPERLRQPKWFFEKFTPEELRRFLNGCGLEPEEKGALLDVNSWTALSNGCVVVPSRALILSLNPLARQTIYCRLAQSRSNYAQHRAFVLSSDALQGRSGATGISEGTADLIRRLSYTDQGQLCFADLEAVQSVLPHDEFERLARILYHVPAYRLRLRVTGETDLQALLQYWGKGGRERFIEPLLEGLAQVPGGASISLSSLLPPFAATRLYTFPCSWDDPVAGQQDCFYTALNFFRESPDTNFLNPSFVERTLELQYAPIGDQPTYGDLVLLMSEEGECIHVCVYIADSFVFTKNGVNPLQPWVLMHLRDVLSYYPAKAPPKFTVVRRREYNTVSKSSLHTRQSLLLATNRVPVRFRSP